MKTREFELVTNFKRKVDYKGVTITVLKYDTMWGTLYSATLNEMVNEDKKYFYSDNKAVDVIKETIDKNYK